MPSDPSGVSPIGVLARPAPDFFDDHLAFGGFQFNNGTVTGNHFLLCSLFNNASSGLAFKVYGISAAADGGSGCCAWVDNLPLIGTYAGPCFNIRADQGAPYGQIFQDVTTQANPLPNPYTFPATAALIGTSGFDSMTYLSPFPLFIVPVGYALHVLNVTAGGLLGASFWYQQANE